MKILYISIIVITIAAIFSTNYASAQSLSPSASTPNNPVSMRLSEGSYFAGDTITVTGTSTANFTTLVSLIDNHGFLVTSAQVTADKYGVFTAGLAIPKDATTSIWQVMATGGLEQERIDVIVNSINQTMPTINFCCTTFSFEVSPLEQFKSGVSPQDVKCEQGFQLILKAENNSPACVLPDNAEKLVSRGWAQNILLILMPKNIYAPGEKIDLTINFKGLVRESCSQPHVIILDSNQNVVWRGTESTQLCISAPFGQSYYVDRTYNLLSDLGGPVIISQAGNYTVKVSFYEQSLEKHFSVNSRND
ncbi:MAG: hypothetical protein ACREBI_05955 [Nitrosotalea sp.]